MISKEIMIDIISPPLAGVIGGFAELRTFLLTQDTEVGIAAGFF
jgi:hypothetical protein